MPTYTWQKSSYSGNAGNCVYVRNDRDGTLRVRESDAPDTTLAASPATFGAFIRAAKAGRFDHIAAVDHSQPLKRADDEDTLALAAYRASQTSGTFVGVPHETARGRLRLERG
ncbi:DUF397 domain-containing protein [Streptomyces sp. NPDC021212]|uniref:DUF397 domain-containing protein n=1 Tax=Streptomyces sp. NPDC021212 TaxID=3365118 RepID=UPI0037B5D3BE